MTNKKVNQFTHGEWVIPNLDTLTAVNCGVKHIAMANFNAATGIDKRESIANAQLIATAGTTATKLAEMGYDAVALLGQLPELINYLLDGRDLTWYLENLEV